jgi:hypothetical protein
MGFLNYNGVIDLFYGDSGVANQYSFHPTNTLVLLRILKSCVIQDYFFTNYATEGESTVSKVIETKVVELSM